MAKTEKVANYSPELTEKVKALYTAGETVEAIAKVAGKTTRSVIAKLSKEGVYKKKEYTGKNGEKPVKKDAMADTIGESLGFSDGETTSLAKVNKTVLRKLAVALGIEVSAEAETEAE